MPVGISSNNGNNKSSFTGGRIHVEKVQNENGGGPIDKK
jgi:hypothetical protein